MLHFKWKIKQIYRAPHHLRAGWWWIQQINMREIKTWAVYLTSLLRAALRLMHWRVKNTREARAYATGRERVQSGSDERSSRLHQLSRSNSARTLAIPIDNWRGPSFNLSENRARNAVGELLEIVSSEENKFLRFLSESVEINILDRGRCERSLFIALGRVQLTRRTMCSNNLRDACCQHNYVPKRPWVLSRLWSCNFVSLFKQFYLAHKLNNWHTSLAWHSLRGGGCCARRATKGEGKIEFLWTAKRGVIKKYHTPRFSLSLPSCMSHYQFMHTLQPNNETLPQRAQKYKPTVFEI